MLTEHDLAGMLDSPDFPSLMVKYVTPSGRNAALYLIEARFPAFVVTKYRYYERDYKVFAPGQGAMAVRWMSNHGRWVLRFVDLAMDPGDDEGLSLYDSVAHPQAARSNQRHAAATVIQAAARGLATRRQRSARRRYFAAVRAGTEGLGTRRS